MQDQWNRKGAQARIREAGLKKVWIAERLGMQPQTLSKALSNSKKPKKTFLMALAMTLGCSLEFLLHDEADKKAG